MLGDPLAMAMYVLSITSLVQHGEIVRQEWCADDATAGGKLKDLDIWWDHFLQVGSDYGCCSNPTKTWLVVKEHYFTEATTL